MPNELTTELLTTLMCSDISTIITDYCKHRIVPLEDFKRDWSSRAFEAICSQENCESCSEWDFGPQHVCRLEEITKNIPTISTPLDPGTFPSNVSEIYYHCYRNHYGDQEWELVSRLTNGTYSFFEARCCYTGFEASGKIKLILSDTLEDLVIYGLSEQVRERYKKFQAYEEAENREHWYEYGE